MTKRKAPCVHHWILEGSASANVPAQCKKCMKKKKFKGASDYWNGKNRNTIIDKPIRIMDDLI